MRSRLTVYTIKCIQKYGQSFVHQNNLLRDIFVLQILCGYISASQTGTDRFFMVIR